jgi:splicing factor U2AF 65 kDa subunit
MKKDSEDNKNAGETTTEIWIAPVKSEPGVSPNEKKQSSKRPREEEEENDGEDNQESSDNGDGDNKDSKKKKKEGEDAEKESEDDGSKSKRSSKFHAEHNAEEVPFVKGRLFHRSGPTGWDVTTPFVTSVPGLSSTFTQSSVRPVVANTNNISQQTRHARRAYASGFEPGTSESAVTNFFSNILITGAKAGTDPGKVLTCYVNSEKSYAFVEFNSIELTNSIVALENSLSFNGRMLRLKRPNDYKPELLDAAQRSRLDDNFDSSKFTMSSTSSSSLSSSSSSSSSSSLSSTSGGSGSRDSIHRIFIGGIPREMDETMLRELFQTFGALKTLTVNKGPDGTPKGFAFCEYVDTNVTDNAVAALNGISLFNRSLTVTRAKKPTVTAPAPESTLSAASSVGINSLVLPNASALVAMSRGPTSLLPPLPLAVVQNQNEALALQQFNQLAQKSASSAAQLVPGVHGPKGTTSSVVCLENMVTASELADDTEYADILDDIRDEGSKYGQLKVTLPRPPLPSAGRVFLHYQDQANAVKAAFALAGRKFGSNVVTSRYYPEQDFLEGRLHL